MADPSPPLTDAALAALRAENAERLRLEAAATPGPWLVGTPAWPGPCGCLHGPCRNLYAGDHFDVTKPCAGMTGADAAFCAHARTYPAGPAVAALLAEVDRLRSWCAYLEEDIEGEGYPLDRVRQCWRERQEDRP